VGGTQGDSNQNGQIIFTVQPRLTTSHPRRLSLIVLSAKFLLVCSYDVCSSIKIYGIGDQMLYNSTAFVIVR